MFTYAEDAVHAKSAGSVPSLAGDQAASPHSGRSDGVPLSDAISPSLGASQDGSDLPPVTAALCASAHVTLAAAPAIPE
jgi:hypothetical protein